MASGSQRGIRSVKLRAGEFDNAGGNTLSTMVWKAFLGVREGNGTTCTATAFDFSIWAWGVLLPAMYAHI